MTTPDGGERPRVVGIIAAGGSGERLGADGPKAFVFLAGRPMVDWSHDVLAAVCDRVVVAVPAGYEDDGPDRIVGGVSRSASVRNAVVTAPEATVFVVHDAARPLIDHDLIERCLEPLQAFDGAVAAVRLTDTVKQADGAGRVMATLDRSTLWTVQTPQAFRAVALRAALEVDEALLASASDDASLVERAGGEVAIVEGHPSNLKITSPLDLAIAHRLIEEVPRGV